jgi:hypothetical protein
MVNFAVAVWAEGCGILNGVFAALAEWNPMMNLKIGRAVRTPKKWSLGFALLADTVGAMENRNDNIGVPTEAHGNNLYPLGNLRGICELRGSGTVR